MHHDPKYHCTLIGETATKIMELLSIDDLDAKTIHLMSGESCLFLKPSLSFLKDIKFINKKREKYSISNDGRNFLKSLVINQ
ncbi:MAG: hypothetical protein ACFFCS_09810 [Candidatus Hodarchaeota archaeon]